MKTKIITALIVGLSLVGCRKDDDAPAPITYPEENPLSSYLTNSGFNQKTTNFINAGSYEFGYRFTPKVKGKINAVTFKIPDNATNVRVTIWDVATKTVLRTLAIPNVTANTEVKQAMDPMNVEVSKKYLITYNGDDWYKRSKTDNTNALYPINAGNITIDGYNWTSGTSQIYPTTLSNDYYGGDLSIVFQQTE